MEREDDMRKYLTLILSLLALMCALCVSAQAEAPETEQAVGKLYIETVDEIDISEARRLAEAQSTQSPVNTENWEAAKRTLKQGIQEMQDDINVSRYAIPIESIKELYLEVAYENPDLFYAKTGYICSYSDSSGEKIAWAISPCYTTDGSDERDQLTDEDKQEIRRQQAILEQKLLEIMQEVRSDWSDLTKAMYLHDYIAIHCTYDYDYKYYDAYRMLINGTGVCQGYTMAYRLLLNRAGVTSSWVQSDSLRHVWSLVQLDGAWYHVDVTWDDSTWFAKSGRKYFCISEEKMKSAELRHLEKDDWVYGTDVQADSKNTITIIGAISIVRLWQLEKTCIIWMETKSWRRMTRNIREPRKKRFMGSGVDGAAIQDCRVTTAGWSITRWTRFTAMIRKRSRNRCFIRLRTKRNK